MNWLRRLFIGGFRPIKRPNFGSCDFLEIRQENARRELPENSVKSLRAELSDAVRTGDRDRAKRLTRKVVSITEGRGR